MLSQPFLERSLDSRGFLGVVQPGNRDSDSGSISPVVASPAHCEYVDVFVNVNHPSAL